MGRITLSPGDALLLYTDGLSETENRRGEEFGEERILHLLREHRRMAAEALKNELVREIRDFAHGELGFDDLTLVDLRTLSEPAPGTESVAVTSPD